MDITSANRAAIIGGGVQNKVLQSSVTTKPRKVVFIGQGDPSKGFVENVPTQVFSSADVGDKTGFGWPLHRMAKYFEMNASGIDMYVINQAYNVSGAAASGSIKFNGTAATDNGTVYLYIAGELIDVGVTSGNTVAQIATATVTAINADPDMPVIAVIDGVDDAKVNIVAKMEGTYGNGITIEAGLLGATLEPIPAGITSYTIVDMASGANDPDIITALAGLGAGDNQNSIDATLVLHAYGQVATPVAALSTYNGVGNTFNGNYSKTVMKPFRSLVGNVATTTALSDLITFTDARKTDRTSGVIAVPGSYTHPCEIAAAAGGVVESRNIDVPNKSYNRQVLYGVWAGPAATRWTDNYADRDIAVKAGISPTLIIDNNVTLTNVMSFYRPADIPESSRFFATFENISLCQNLLYSSKIWWSVDEWQNYAIVNDASNVTDRYGATYVKDLQSVIANWAALVRDWESKGWIFDSSYTIDEIKKAGAVAIRSGSLSGFDSQLKIVAPQIGSVFNYTIFADTSIAVFNV